jgi:chaperonin cofactor prefoldin
VSKEPKKATDWEGVELAYRAGLLPLRDIGERFGISEGAIRKKAKNAEPPWERDLGVKIQQRAEAMVARREAAKVVSPEKIASEKEVVEVNARAVADVRMAHRKHIDRGQVLVVKLLDELEHQTDHRELYEQLGDLMYKPNENGTDKLNELYHKVISLQGRSSTFKTLTDSLKSLIGLEREAWNIGAEDLNKGDTGKTMTDAERASRMASILASARSKADAS